VIAGTIPLIVDCTQSPEGHVTEEYERETHWSHEGEDGPAGAGVRGGVPGNVPGVSTASDACELHFQMKMVLMTSTLDLTHQKIQTWLRKTGYQLFQEKAGLLTSDCMVR